MQTDNQLIRRIKKKQDKKAADELIQRYYREIYAFTYRQTGERELALDLTQEIFITVLQGIYAFDEKKAGFRTWAYRVAANRITDYYRSKSYKKEKLQQPLQWETEEEKTARDLAEHMVQKEEIRRIMDIVVSYEREWIRIFQKKCFEEKTFAQIAEEMDLAESTVKTRFYQMLKRIRQEKEWKKEQKIPLLPVEFPEDSVMQKECRAIVEKAIPKRQSLWERSKEIYWGPGIRAIFYQSGSIWLIVACLYLGIGWLGQSYAKQPETQMIIVFLGFPVCFLVFAVLAWWLDAQNHMQELIGSLHYSQSYLSGLRMLYAGVIMILVNVTGAALFTDVSGKAFVSMVLVGSSSVFLFASVCVYACHKGAGGLFYAGLIAVWACVCVIARLAGTGVQMFLFTSVPLAVHGAVTAASFCLLFVSIGKVEKKDAYSFAC